ncbi:MAG: hypothetical protein EAZ55_07545 [Cytophagales bacterium]|nr:MAG: hypothetical protein EAZ55_07545 [Cytophagales bacterium]
MKNIYSVLFFLYLNFNCYAQKDVFSQLNNNWIKLTTVNNEVVIYNPCAAENQSFTVIDQEDKNILAYHWGQQSSFHQIILILELTNGIKAKLDDGSEIELVEFDTQKNIYKLHWSDNQNTEILSILFTNEKNRGNFKIVNQPCTDCWQLEDCN